MREAWLAWLAAGLATAALAQPRIDAIDPSQGPIAGGTVVTIRGANLDGVPVKLDRAVVTPLLQTATEVRLQIPAHDNGYALISIGDVYGRFLYVPPDFRNLPPGSITTVAGIGQYVGEYGPATDAAVRPGGLAYGPDGLLYFSDAVHNRVFRVRNGIIEPVAGTGFSVFGPHERGLALDTAMSFPHNLAFDSHGNLYVPDATYYLWRVRPDGTAQVIAGTGKLGFSGDGGPATQAAIGYPGYVAVDSDDNVYFIDFTSARVRKIDTNGIISTYVGTGTFGFSGDGGPAAEAQFNLSDSDRGDLTVDRNGNLLLLDYSNHRIRRIDRQTHIITTAVAPATGGPGLNDLRAMGVSPSNEIYLADNNIFFRQNSDGALIKVAGAAAGGFAEDGGLFSAANFGSIADIAFDPAGNLVYSDDGPRRARMVDGAGHIQTLAGGGPQSLGEGGPAIAAAMLTGYIYPGFLPSGELAIANYDRIWKIDAAGNLVRIAGTGLPGPLEDVSALSARLVPFSMFINADGAMDFVQGYTVLRIGTDGIVRRTAGKFGGCGFSGDGGDARSAVFCQLWEAIRDPQGNLFIADANNNRVRRVDAQSGIITTIAGSGPSNGLERYGFGTTCGDGGPATSACLNTPYGLAFDGAGNLYVAENSKRIRRIDPAGIITTLVETECSKLTWAFGNLFSVHGNSVQRITTQGAVTRLTHAFGFGGDGGPAAQARIESGLQQGIAVDRDGNLFFGDSNNLRVRVIRYGAVLAPPGATIEASGSGSIRATVFDAAHERAAGVRVDFTAPASGPSCTLSSPFAITDANGEVTVNCIRNCLSGSYVVTATPLTAATSARITMTNSDPCIRKRVVPH